MASAKQIAQVQTPSRTENQLQQNIINALHPVLSGKLAVTNLVVDQVLASGTNTINHGLGQMITGYIITKRNGTATIYDNGMTDTTLTLVASAAITVDILCF